MTPERWRQIEELYLAVVDLNTDERAPLLARAGPEVREEVEAMLAQSARSNLFDHAAWDSEPTQSRDVRLTAGALVGPYKLEAKIGAGGIGVVFRAHDS